MRILLVTPLFFPSLSGAAVYFDTLSQSLVRIESAARVTILTRAVAGAPTRERRGAVRVLRLLPRAHRARGSAVERARAAAGAAMVLLVSRTLGSDVVHYHTLASYRGLHRLAPLFRAPLVGDMRDLAARNEGASVAYYRHCRALICASENIRAFLRSQGFPSNKLVHIPIPFRPPRPAPAADVVAARARYGIPGGPYAIFVGAIIPYKGVGELLDAVPLLARAISDFRLVLAGPLTPEGDASFPEGFAGRVARTGRAQWVGPVPHPEVPLLVQGAEVFILPSRTEGLPRSCLEAIGLGTKVVLPPGIPEFDTACPEAVLPTVTPEAIAAKLEATWRHGKPVDYPLQRHDPERIAAATLGVYRAVIPTTPRMSPAMGSSTRR